MSLRRPVHRIHTSYQGELLVRVDDWFDTRVHKLLVKTGYEFTSRRTLLSEKVFSIIKLR